VTGQENFPGFKHVSGQWHGGMVLVLSRFYRYKNFRKQNYKVCKTLESVQNFRKSA